MTTPTGRFAKDPRVDQGIHWLLAILAGGAMIWLTNSVTDLTETVGYLATEVKILRVERESLADLLRLEIRELKARDVALMARVASLEKTR